MSHPSLDIRGAEFALYVLTEYEHAIEQAMDHLDTPPTENAIAVRLAKLRRKRCSVARASTLAGCAFARGAKW